MLDHGLVKKDQGTENKLFQTGQSFREPGNKITQMAKEDLPIQMVIIMKGISLMVKPTVMEFMFAKMGQVNMKDNGSMICNRA